MAEMKLPEVRSNSIMKKKESEPKKEVGKVVSGRVTVKKKGLGSRIHDIFLADDFSTVKEYAIMDVIIPGLKHLIVDSISMLILGETAKKSGRRDGSFVSYGSYYKGEKKEERRERRRANFDYTDEIIFESRGDAELTLDALCDMCEQYGQATLSDFYDLVGETSNFTDEKWGWVDLGRASVRRSGRGYIIDLPKPYPLD